MKRPETRELAVPGPAGDLQTHIATTGPARGVAVICHPHPLYHGTMNNKVVQTLARTFNDNDFAAVRFNFRGVGDSDGDYDEGRGETDDALAVAAWARRQWPARPLWLAGFSFGGFVALRAATRRRPAGLVTVAVPVQRFDVAGLAQPDCPWIIVQGDEDEIVSADAVLDWINALEPGPELVLLEGVDHFFHGRLRVLRQTLNELLAPSIAVADDAEKAS